MANNILPLKVKTGEKDGKGFWSEVGTVFVNTNEAGEITSINVKHCMFPDVDMVAFPRRERDQQQ